MRAVSRSSARSLPIERTRTDARMPSFTRCLSARDGREECVRPSLYSRPLFPCIQAPGSRGTLQFVKQVQTAATGIIAGQGGRALLERAGQGRLGWMIELPRAAGAG